MVIASPEKADQEPDCPIVGKREKTHGRGIVGLWCYNRNGQEMMISIAHDSLKLWRIDEANGIVAFEELHQAKSWRCGVQAADVSKDGKFIAIVGLDSILYEVLLNDEVRGPSVISRDFGYMEVWHLKIAKNGINYMTTSLSSNGQLSEIGMDGNFTRRESYPNVKLVSALAYSDDNNLLAVGNNEGLVCICEVSTLQVIKKFEDHAMKINAIVFTPDGNHIITASEDKTLKLLSLGKESTTPGVIRTYCGNRAGISNVILDDYSEGTRFATSNHRGQIMVWDIEQPIPVYVLPSPHESSVSALTFACGGQFLFSGGEDRRIVAYRIPKLKTDEDTRYAIEEGESQELEDDGYDYGHGNDYPTQYPDSSVPMEA